MEVFWDNKDAVRSSIYFLCFHIVKTNPQDIYQLINQWMEVCKVVELDFDTTEAAYVENALWAFYRFIRACDEKIWGEHPHSVKVSKEVFRILFRPGIGNLCSAQRLHGALTYAAQTMIIELFYCSMRRKASSNDCILYRGLPVSKQVADLLQFSEYAMSLEISQRPDCIFDICVNTTVYGAFCKVGYKAVWDEILKENGFDPDWVMKEDIRRRQAGVGETSAHGVNLEFEASRALQTKRRRAYRNEE